MPSEVVAALALARLTALSKPNGGVRGIATGDSFRRLVLRVLVRQWANAFDAATQPFQYALQARAGTDALAALLVGAAAGHHDSLVGRAECVRLYLSQGFSDKTAGGRASARPPLSGSSTGSRPRTAGGTMRGASGKCARARGVNKGIRLRQPCSRWDAGWGCGHAPTA